MVNKVKNAKSAAHASHRTHRTSATGSGRSVEGRGGPAAGAGAMVRRFGMVAIAFAALAVGNAAYAANLQDVYATALQNDPVIAAARASSESRGEIVAQSRATLLPRVGASAGSSKTAVRVDGLDQTGMPFPERDVTRRNWGANVSQTVVDVPSWFSYLGARATARQAVWDLESASQQLITRVAEAYLNVLRGQAALESALASEEAVRRQLEQVQQRFDVGLVAITDVLDAKAEFDNTVVDRIQAESNQGIFFEGLTTLTATRYDEIDRLDANLPIVDPDPANEEEWVETALVGNYAIRAAQEGLVAAERDLNARLARHLPTISASANYGVGSGSQAFGGFVIPDQTSASMTYSLNINAPIFNGLATQSGVRQARHALDQARQQLIGQELVVARDTRNLYRVVATEVVRVQARAEAIKSAEAALEATQTGYEVGTRNIVEVLLAQRRLFASQFDYARSRYDYVINLLRLKETAGALDERDVGELNTFMDGADPVRRL